MGKGENENLNLPAPRRGKPPEAATPAPKRQPLDDPELAYLLELRDQQELVIWKKVAPDEWQEVATLPHLSIEAECFAAAGHLVAADVWSEELPHEVKSAIAPFIEHRST